jgi:molybdopterin biosynthesis enzyme
MSLPESPQRIARLAPIADVLARVAALARPVAPYELPVTDAHGCVLAADVAAREALPRGPTALWDGWTVRAEAVADAGPYAPVRLAAAPAWVDADGALPADMDAVLPPDAITGNEVHASATAGDGVLGAAADMAAGQVLRRAGEQLRAADVAVLRAAGLTQVSVREPIVRVVSIGADSVASAIARGVSSRGANVLVQQDLEAAIASDGDAIIVVGGTGYNETSVSAVRRAGQVDIHGFGLSPGESAALGSVGTKPVLMLPARLDGALATFLVVGDALLRRLTGNATSGPVMPVKLARKIVSTIGMAEVVPVRRTGEGVEPVASGYWPLQALAAADGWVYVPPESEGFAAGTMVDMRALP